MTADFNEYLLEEISYRTYITFSVVGSFQKQKMYRKCKLTGKVLLQFLSNHRMNVNVFLIKYLFQDQIYFCKSMSYSCIYNKDLTGEQ